jgi:hypothetical protein
VFGSGVDGGRIMPWHCGTLNLEMVRKGNFFFWFCSFIIIFSW